MARESKPKTKQTVGRDLLVTCKSGAQFMFRNVTQRTADMVEAHALSGQPLSLEISDMVQVDWVDSEISFSGSIYPPANQTDVPEQENMHEAHAQNKENHS